ncbi:dentin sialophosphoprotein [Cryptosporidium ubiquitum]|uniref:Dentin sialophosphoprotein n=1 Tax=Cryptosporidium ubiquitum TaxID=857276 RepID=A0A1J4MFI2_9CRYT|nr:dentin sialophosphoprotein [Cryptosporidium ubiquitum]OII72998.1 dentin sialophosphoprotein [Cryptosporidium ubiquitum]
MGVLRLHKFKKLSLISLFLLITLLVFNFELLNALVATENKNDTEVNNSEPSSEKSSKSESLYDQDEANEKTEVMDDEVSSQAMGLFQSNDFDSGIQNGNFDKKETTEKSQEKPSTIKLMEEMPPALDLGDIPGLDGDTNIKEVSNESKPESNDPDSSSPSKHISASNDQEQGSSSASGPASISELASSTSASGSASVSSSTSASTSDSTLDSASASNQVDEEIKIENGTQNPENSGQDFQELQSSMIPKGLRGYKRLQSELSSGGIDSASDSKTSESSGSASGSNSSSGLLLPTVPEDSSDEMKLQLLFRHTTNKFPMLDSTSKEQKTSNDEGTQTNTNSDFSYNPQKGQEINANFPGSPLEKPSSPQMESEVEESKSEKSKTDTEIDESEFSSDVENNVEFPEDNSNTSSYADASSSTDSNNKNTKVRETTFIFEKPGTQEVSTVAENLENLQENPNKHISVATQTTPVKRHNKNNVRRRRRGRVITKKGLSQLIKELNNSKTRKKMSFFKKLIGQISDKDINLISNIIEREKANREKSNLLRKTLTSNIPDRPLLGKEWIEREKSRNKQD